MNVKVPAVRLQLIKRLAKQHGLTLNEYINQTIEEIIRREGARIALAVEDERRATIATLEALEKEAEAAAAVGG